eukprot:1313223-Amphidinium_carterae.1
MIVRTVSAISSPSIAKVAMCQANNHSVLSQKSLGTLEGKDRCVVGGRVNVTGGAWWPSRNCPLDTHRPKL